MISYVTRRWRKAYMLPKDLVKNRYPNVFSRLEQHSKKDKARIFTGFR